MFTGIIERIGTVSKVESKLDRIILRIQAEDFTHDLKPGSSVAVDGTCLTVTNFTENSFEIDAVKETLSRTTIPHFKTGRKVNLEKAVQLSSRLDGHLVQGHIDGTGTLIRKLTSAGNVLLTLKLSVELVSDVVSKGSIAIDGISLTVVNIQNVNITVAIVPFTFERTTLKNKKTGDTFNIETDIIGKYVKRFIDNKSNRKSIAPYF